MKKRKLKSKQNKIIIALIIILLLIIPLISLISAKLTIDKETEESLEGEVEIREIGTEPEVISDLFEGSEIKLAFQNVITQKQGENLKVIFKEKGGIYGFKGDFTKTSEGRIELGKEAYIDSNYQFDNFDPEFGNYVVFDKQGRLIEAKFKVRNDKENIPSSDFGGAVKSSEANTDAGSLADSILNQGIDQTTGIEMENPDVLDKIEYSINDYFVYLSPGTELEFKNKLVHIKVPQGSSFSKEYSSYVNPLNRKNPDNQLLFKYESLEGGPIYFDYKQNSFKLEKGALYSNEDLGIHLKEKTIFNNLEITSNSPENPIAFLFFNTDSDREKRVIDKGLSYIKIDEFYPQSPHYIYTNEELDSITPELLEQLNEDSRIPLGVEMEITSNLDGDGPIVRFNNGNNILPYADGDYNLVMQAGKGDKLGAGTISLKNYYDENEVRITGTGLYTLDNGEKSYFSGFKDERSELFLSKTNRLPESKESLSRTTYPIGITHYREFVHGEYEDNEGETQIIYTEIGSDKFKLYTEGLVNRYVKWELGVKQYNHPIVISSPRITIERIEGSLNDFLEEGGVPRIRIQGVPPINPRRIIAP